MTGEATESILILIATLAMPHYTASNQLRGATCFACHACLRVPMQVARVDAGCLLCPRACGKIYPYGIARDL